VSAMSRTFVSDPRSVVKPGDVVRVKVLSVDIPRHRISLTLRLDDEGPPQAARPGPRPAGGRARPQGRSSGNFGRTDRGSSGAMADALRRAGLTPGAPKRPGTGSIG
jgi:protein Tex